MLRSLSFRQKPTQSLSDDDLKALQKKIAVQPEPEDVLLWLKTVKPDRVLLLVPADASTGKPSYVKSDKANWILMISEDPTRSMVDLHKLFERMLPAKADVALDVWRAAKPLKTWLASDEVKKQGLRNTQALTEALRTLSKARQAQLDRQGVHLEPIPTEKEEDVDPPEVGLELDQETPRLQPEDLHAAWKLATTSNATTQPIVSNTSPSSPDAGDRKESPQSPTRGKHTLVRRSKSAALRSSPTLNKSSSFRRPPKDGANN